MDEELLRRLVAGREEQRGPEDAVEPQDVLREQVVGRGPILVAEVFSRPRVRERAEVVDERVNPDVRDLALVPGKRDPPWLPRPRDAEIAEPARDERPRLVEAEVRADEVRPLVVEGEELVLVGGEPEEVVLLLDPLGRHEVIRAEPVGRQLLLGLERLAADAVQAGIDVLVHVAVVVDPLEEVLDETLVSVVARAQKEVDVGVETWRELTPRHCDAICVLLRLEALLLGDAPDLRRVLVDAGQKERSAPRCF